MFSNYTKEQLAIISKESEYVREKTKEKRAETSGKPKEGSITISAFFGQLQPEIKSKKAGGKAPPRRADIIISGIETLISTVTDPSYYRVDSPTQISIPHRNQKILADITKQLKEEKDPERIEELKAKHKLEYNNIRAWTPLYNGKVIAISTFSSGNLDELKPRQPISCIQLVGEYSEDDNGNIYQSLSCKQVFGLVSEHTVYVRLSASFNLSQIPFNVADDRNLVYFSDYLRCVEEEGPVISQNYVDFTEQGCKFIREGEPEKMKLDMSIWQKTENSQYCIMGTLWDQTKDAKEFKINRCFGIDDITLHAKIMSSNKIPAVAICTTNRDKTPPNQTNSNAVKTATVYINEPYFFLREYLLQCGLKVSFPFIKALLCSDKDTPDKQAYVSLDNPEKPCRLNSINRDRSNKMINDKVINASSFTGNLFDLHKQGCEWRILHASNPYDIGTRMTEGCLPIDQAEKMAKSAQYIVVYAVMPMTEREMELNQNPALVNAAVTATVSPVTKNEFGKREPEVDVEPEVEVETKKSKTKTATKTKSQKSKK